MRVITRAWLVGALVLTAAGWLLFDRAEGPPTARTYVEGVVGRLAYINPLVAQPGTPDADVAALVFAGLTRPGRDGSPIPDLAERWDVTPDGRTYTFQLRAGLSWHDGRPLTADDVAFTIALVQARDFEGRPELAAAWRGVETLVPDERTVILTLPAARASFLADTVLGVLPGHLLAGVDGAALLDAPFNLSPVGAGPFRLDTADEDGARLSAFPAYHLGPAPLPGIEFKLFPDEAALADAITRGGVDAALLPDDTTSPLAAAAAARPDLEERPWPVSGYEALYLNNQRPPLNDPSVRLAVAVSLDLVALARNVHGPRAVLDAGPIPPPSWAFPTTADPGVFSRDLELADQLLTDAGWLPTIDGPRFRDGIPLALELVTNSAPDRVRTAEGIASQLDDIGAAVEVVSLPAVQLVQQRLQPHDFTLALFGWDVGVDPDPYGAWHTSQITGGRNFAGFTDPESDALLEAARLTLDVRERIGLYARFRQRFQELVPSIVMRFPVRTYLQPATLDAGAPGLLFDPASRFREAYRWRFTE